jgi:hypothetical protein
MNVANRDFGLRPTSPAIDQGTNLDGFEKLDLGGGDRVIRKIDIGAFEYGN